MIVYWKFYGNQNRSEVISFVEFIFQCDSSNLQINCSCYSSFNKKVILSFNLNCDPIDIICLLPHFLIYCSKRRYNFSIRRNNQSGALFPCHCLNEAYKILPLDPKTCSLKGLHILVDILL